MATYPRSGQVWLKRIPDKVRPVLPTLADVAPAEPDDFVILSCDSQSIAISPRVTLEEVRPHVSQSAKSANTVS